jgi:hypothetical protein
MLRLCQVPVDDERVKLRGENGIWATDTLEKGHVLGEAFHVSYCVFCMQCFNKCQ